MRFQRPWGSTDSNTVAVFIVRKKDTCARKKAHQRLASRKLATLQTLDTRPVSSFSCGDFPDHFCQHPHSEFQVLQGESLVVSVHSEQFRSNGSKRGEVIGDDSSSPEKTCVRCAGEEFGDYGTSPGHSWPQSFRWPCRDRCRRETGAGRRSQR